MDNINKDWIYGKERKWKYIPYFNNRYGITEDGIVFHMRGRRPLTTHGKNKWVTLSKEGVRYTYSSYKLYAEIWLLGRALREGEAWYLDGEGNVAVGDWVKLVSEGVISPHADGYNQFMRQSYYAPSIKEDYRSGKYTVAELAESYHISRDIISTILKGIYPFDKASLDPEERAKIARGLKKCGSPSPYLLANSIVVRLGYEEEL